MESNIEVIDQEVEKARAKYGDKDIPPDEIQNFKVSKLVEFHLYHYFFGNPGWFKELYLAKGLISYLNSWILSKDKWCGATFFFALSLIQNTYKEYRWHCHTEWENTSNVNCECCCLYSVVPLFNCKRCSLCSVVTLFLSCKMPILQCNLSQVFACI